MQPNDPSPTGRIPNTYERNTDLDAATLFAVAAMAVRMQTSRSRAEDAELRKGRANHDELLHAIAWSFELISEGLGGEQAPREGEACGNFGYGRKGSIGCGGQACAYCGPWTPRVHEILAPFVQALAQLGLQRSNPQRPVILGPSVDPRRELLFVIADAKRRGEGEVIRWWAAENAGYETARRLAGRYTLATLREDGWRYFKKGDCLCVPTYIAERLKVNRKGEVASSSQNWNKLEMAALDIADNSNPPIGGGR